MEIVDFLINKVRILDLLKGFLLMGLGIYLVVVGRKYGGKKPSKEK